MGRAEVRALADEAVHVAEGFLLDLLARADGYEQEEVDVSWVQEGWRGLRR
jgi:hypothetical protein